MLSNKKFLVLLFLFSFMLRALLFINFTSHGTNAWIYVDSEQYNNIANNIVQGNGICMEPGTPQYYRLPGYPLFLAACYILRQASDFAKASTDRQDERDQVQAALWIQIMLASFIPVLIFLLSLTLFPQQQLLAQLAGIVSSVHLGFVLYAGMLATESLSVLFLLLFFILLLHAPGRRYYFLAGIMLGIASLIRPVGHYVLVIALTSIFVILDLFQDHVSFKQKIWQSSVLACGWLVIVTPWLLRNFLLTGYIFFHSLPGLHFVQYTAANIVMQRDHSSYPQARAIVLNEWNSLVAQKEVEQGGALSEYERCRVGESLTATYIKQYPAYALKHMTIEIFKTCAGLYSAIILLADGAAWPDYGPNVTNWSKVQRFLFPAVKRPFLAALIYSEIIMLLLMIFGFGLFLIYCWYDYTARRALYLFMPYVLLFIGITLAYGGARLRMPADPFLIITALYGWISWTQYFFRRKLS